MKAQIGPFREQKVADYAAISDLALKEIERGEITAQIRRCCEKPHMHFAIWRHRPYPDIGDPNLPKYLNRIGNSIAQAKGRGWPDQPRPEFA